MSDYWEVIPDSTPLTLETLTKAVNRMSEATYLPSQIIVSPKVYKEYDWFRRMTRINVDWRLALFPTMTRVSRWVDRLKWKWRMRHEHD